MRAIHAAAAVLLAVTVTGCSATGMYANGADGGRGLAPFGFSVQPSVVAAGGRVTLRVDRDGVCRDKVMVTSGVFPTVVVPPRGTTATATVDPRAVPGATYLVTFSCTTTAGSAQLTIAGGGSRRQAEPLQPAYPVRHVRPERGVRAGEGGSAGGFDAGEIGLGTALVAGSAAAAYRLLRRRTADGGA
ncbi:hypothetical protein [Streptomyces sp. NPDC047000]|uniref:hypothetical protein n=1 Tax=Streptomyces sp. NPDC047000 TaxID=3155474 RepID=UPI0033D73C7E